MKIKFFIISVLSLSLLNDLNATSSEKFEREDNQEVRSLSAQQRIAIVFFGMSILGLLTYKGDLLEHYFDQSHKFLEFRENNLIQDIVSIKNGLSLNQLALPLKIIKLLGQEFFIRGLNFLISFGLFMTFALVMEAIFHDDKIPNSYEILLKIPIIPGITI